MTDTPVYSADQLETDLQNIAARCRDDPLAYVMAVYPWGVPGTRLAKEEGPENWQKEIMGRIARHISSGGSAQTAMRIAISSGHGVGKTALIGWLIEWFMVTRPNCLIKVMANTDTQVKNVTWRELARWLEMSIFRGWFEITATQMYEKGSPATWRAMITNWSKDNPDAVQGSHEDDMLFVMDEAAGIIDSVWPPIEGAMTHGAGAYWIVTGNPTRNTGQFKKCFAADSPWSTMQVSRLDVRRGDPSYPAYILKHYGPDQYKIRVLGQFPDTDLHQFLSGSAIRMAYERGLFDWGDDKSNFAPVVLGVDVARSVDETVIIARRGNHILFIDRRKGMELYPLAELIAEYAKKLKPVSINVDSVGMGQGVVDHLRAVGYRGITFGVNGGASPRHKDRFFNLRCETWGLAREWIGNSGVLNEDDPNHVKLIEQGVGILYGYNQKGQLRLERKEELIKREGWSPDIFDALALTFARRVPISTDEGAGHEPKVIY